MKKKKQPVVTTYPTKLSGEVNNYNLKDTGYAAIKKIHLAKQGIFFIFTISE